VTAIFFGLATALAWGITSLCSARASRIMGAAPTLAFVSLFGLILSIPFAVSDSRTDVSSTDILWAGLAGLGNVVGLLLIYGLYSGGRVAGVVPGGWIVASARIIGVGIVTLPLLASGRLRLARAALPWIVITAIAEVIGYWMSVLGSRADIATTAILASQFAAVTAIGAYFFLGERLSRLQRVGVLIVCVGVGMLAWVEAQPSTPAPQPPASTPVIAPAAAAAW
jgi:drug/metabolite transporter (DMT)-like permease